MNVEKMIELLLENPAKIDAQHAELAKQQAESSRQLQQLAGVVDRTNAVLIQFIEHSQRGAAETQLLIKETDFRLGARIDLLLAESFGMIRKKPAQN